MIEPIIFENDFKFEDGYQCLYFYINDMPFHKKMISMIENLSIKFPMIKYYFINASIIEKSFLKRFDILEVPIILLFNNSIKLLEVKGVVLQSSIKHQFNNVLYGR